MPRSACVWIVGVLALGCGEPSVLPSAGDDAIAVAAEPGPTRYELSDGERVLGIAELSANGRATFTIADNLPAPCLADTLAEQWEAFVWPDSIMVDASYYDPETQTHNKAGANFDRESDDYPLAVVHAFLRTGYQVEPSLPIDRRGERKGPPPLPATFSVTADVGRDAPPENFTRLPLGEFTIKADGTVSLATACEGEYLAARLKEHFAQEELVISFRQPGGRWNPLAQRSPGDLRVTDPQNADVRIRYRSGEAEYFAALMTIVDRAFGVALNVEPEPTLSVSYP